MFSSVLRSLFFCSFIITSSLAGTWSLPKDLSQPISSGYPYPVVGMDPKGNATVVWQGYDGTHFIIQSSWKPFDRRWKTPHPNIISKQDQDSFAPQIVVDRKGNATAVWASNNGTHSFIQASYRPAGHKWRRPVVIYQDTHESYDPRLGVDKEGNLIVVWKSYDGANYLIHSAYKPFKKKWRSPHILFQTTQKIEELTCGVSSHGSAMAVWTMTDGTSWKLLSAFKPVHKKWRHPLSIYQSSATLSDPHVVLDPHNNATAIWSSFEGNISILSSTKPCDKRWKKAVSLFLGSYACNPRIVGDKEGNVTAVWQIFDATVSKQRIEASYKPFKKRWKQPSPISSATEDANEPDLAIDHHGNIAVVWHSNYEAPPGSSHYGIQVRRKPFEKKWRHIQNVFSQTLQAVSSPKIALDDHGNATAVWIRRDGLDYVVQGATYTHSR